MSQLETLRASGRLDALKDDEQHIALETPMYCLSAAHSATRWRLTIACGKVLAKMLV